MRVRWGVTHAVARSSHFPAPPSAATRTSQLKTASNPARTKLRAPLSTRHTDKTTMLQALPAAHVCGTAEETVAAVQKMMQYWKVFEHDAERHIHYNALVHALHNGTVLIEKVEFNPLSLRGYFKLRILVCGDVPRAQGWCYHLHMFADVHHTRVRVGFRADVCLKFDTVGDGHECRGLTGPGRAVLNVNVDRAALNESLASSGRRTLPHPPRTAATLPSSHGRARSPVDSASTFSYQHGQPSMLPSPSLPYSSSPSMFARGVPSKAPRRAVMPPLPPTPADDECSAYPAGGVNPAVTMVPHYSHYSPLAPVIGGLPASPLRTPAYDCAPYASSYDAARAYHSATEDEEEKEEVDSGAGSSDDECSLAHSVAASVLNFE
ncbi:hypothetical protein EON67_09960, partial [archaeon]